MSDSSPFSPPGFGTWIQDRAHIPLPVSGLFSSQWNDSMGRGFGETVDRYGALIQSVTYTAVNHYCYLRFHFVGEPGADGPPSEEAVGAEIGRRIPIAAEALETRVWREVLALWDSEIKPAAVARHRELGATDPQALDDETLAEYVVACLTHDKEMKYQHHRFNLSALFPAGDLLLNTSMWTGRSTDDLLGLFEGHSPISGVWSEEIADAARAIESDSDAMKLLEGNDPDALNKLRSALPAVDLYVGDVENRLIDGFDYLNPTLSETPGIILGKLAAAVKAGGPADTSNSSALEQEIRDLVPDESRATFDEMLGDARLMYRLRDERGVYSDMWSAGLVRGALLEAGKRLAARGVCEQGTDLFEATAEEIEGLLQGSNQAVASSELASRRRSRIAAADFDAPPLLGPPPPEPPPPGALPPPLERVMSAIGYIVPALFDEVAEPSTEGNQIDGLRGSGGVYEGTARLITDVTDLIRVEQGDVLVAPTTSEAFSSVVYMLGAIVTDHGGVAAHAAIVAREVGIPAVVGTSVASSRISDGARVRVDGNSGTVTLLD